MAYIQVMAMAETHARRSLWASGMRWWVWWSTLCPAGMWLPPGGAAFWPIHRTHSFPSLAEIWLRRAISLSSTRECCEQKRRMFSQTCHCTDCGIYTQGKWEMQNKVQNLKIKRTTRTAFLKVYSHRRTVAAYIKIGTIRRKEILSWNHDHPKIAANWILWAAERMRRALSITCNIKVE